MKNKHTKKHSQIKQTQNQPASSPKASLTTSKSSNKLETDTKKLGKRERAKSSNSHKEEDGGSENIAHDTRTTAANSTGQEKLRKSELRNQEI
jgi:hypothetical protein